MVSPSASARALHLPAATATVVARTDLARPRGTLQRLVGVVGARAVALLITVLAASPAAALTMLNGAALTRQPYIQNVGQTSVTILWRTSTPVAMRVEYGEDFRYDAAVTEPQASTRHEVTLTGLKAGTTYHYRLVEADVVASGPQYSFRTDPGRGSTSFSFFATADVGENETASAYQQYTQAAIRRVTPRPDFGLLAGDIVYPDGNSNDYDRNLMRPWAQLLCNTAVWPALGNHDWQSNPDTNFEVEWALPNNEHYYSFDYGNAHFIALDTRDGSLYNRTGQLVWLQQDLAANSGATWTFVFYHHPLITCTYKGNEPDMAADLMPLFERYGVDLVFTGHAHTYERLYPIRAGMPIDQDQDPNYVDPRGVLYVVSGCGGKFKLDAPTTYCGPTAYFLDGRILFTQVLVRDRRLFLLTFDSLSGGIVDFMSVTQSPGMRFRGGIPHVAAANLDTPRSRLLRNMPNPFNPSTVIPFAIAAAGPVFLDVYGADGRWIANLASGFRSAGTHQVAWNGLDHAGQPVPSGIYVARLRTSEAAENIKMTLVR